MATKKKTSNKKVTKKAVKTATKMAKKNPKVFLIILLVIVIAAGAGFAVWFFVLRNNGGKSPTSSSSSSTTSEVISSSTSSSSSSSSESSHSHEGEYNPALETPSGISINFLEFGNHNTGDCTYIKAGDFDILIDAGSKNKNVDRLKTFINQYCTDGKLEYVIATHNHEDHISGFYNEAGRTGIFYSYQIGTLIDFALTNKTSTATTTQYGKYLRDRDARLASGDIEHHYTAAECVDNENPAPKEYVITDAVKMTILDQRFYHETSGDENNYSVCALFTHNDNNHYLFTGDLEKEGEKSLVELNTLPHCELFKGGHHGSKTSNTDALLSVITPEVVCICCCAGNDEYTSAVDNQFPTQTAINNIAKYTEYIYVTTVTTDGHTGFASMNGDICFKSEDGDNYTVAGSNNSTILKDTDWFKDNRTWPSA